MTIRLGGIIIAISLMCCIILGCTSNQAAEVSRMQTTPTLFPSKTYELDWKLAEGEIIAYQTTMNPVEESKTNFSFNFEDLEGDKTGLFSELGEVLSDLQIPTIGSLISILELNSNGNIDIKMILADLTIPKTDSDNPLAEGFNDMMQDMIGTVQLRGEVTPDGEIASFYLAEQQENLISIFFELPTEPVQVGDTWSLNFNCISMGNGFVAESAARTNTVQFVELSQTAEGSPVAVIDYVVLEIVGGTFISPFSEDVMDVSMTCSFLGRGRFLIDQGRWEQLVGEMAVQSDGFMTSNVIQEIALTPLDEIPPEYLDLE